MEALLLTLPGGALFAWTYLRTKSTLAAGMEHALYGFWAFFVGLGWFVFMMPPAVLIYVLGALAVTRIFAIDDSVRAAPTASSDGGDERDGDGGRDADAVRATDATGTADTGVDEAAPDDLTGPADLTRDQRLVGGVMLGTILLWVVGSPLGLSSIVPPLLAVCLLAAPGVGVVTTRDVRNVNWDVLLLFGGVFSLTNTATAGRAATAMTASWT